MYTKRHCFNDGGCSRCDLFLLAPVFRADAAVAAKNANLRRYSAVPTKRNQMSLIFISALHPSYTLCCMHAYDELWRICEGSCKIDSSYDNGRDVTLLVPEWWTWFVFMNFKVVRHRMRWCQQLFMISHPPFEWGPGACSIQKHPIYHSLIFRITTWRKSFKGTHNFILSTQSVWRSAAGCKQVNGSIARWCDADEPIAWINFIYIHRSNRHINSGRGRALSSLLVIVLLWLVRHPLLPVDHRCNEQSLLFGNLDNGNERMSLHFCPVGGDYDCL